MWPVCQEWQALFILIIAECARPRAQQSGNFHEPKAVGEKEPSPRPHPGPLPSDGRGRIVGSRFGKRTLVRGSSSQCTVGRSRRFSTALEFSIHLPHTTLLWH